MSATDTFKIRTTSNFLNGRAGGLAGAVSVPGAGPEPSFTSCNNAGFHHFSAPLTATRTCPSLCRASTVPVIPRAPIMSALWPPWPFCISVNSSSDSFKMRMLSPTTHFLVGGPDGATSNASAGAGAETGAGAGAGAEAGAGTGAGAGEVGAAAGTSLLGEPLTLGSASKSCGTPLRRNMSSLLNSTCSTSSSLLAHTYIGVSVGRGRTVVNRARMRRHDAPLLWA